MPLGMWRRECWATQASPGGPMRMSDMSTVSIHGARAPDVNRSTIEARSRVLQSNRTTHLCYGEAGHALSRAPSSGSEGRFEEPRGKGAQKRAGLDLDGPQFSSG